MTIQIHYKSRQANREAYWSEPVLETLSETHVQLHSSVRETLNQIADVTSDEHCSDSVALALIYQTFNHDTANPLSAYHVSGGLQDWMNDAGIGHTSMSRNDVVCINGTYYACESTGWTILN
tara:strand:+ start:435 stop:800 length:366 start_codon:yes stop_codon:yes gene_type:complete